jgi:hypothetical protein
MLETLNAHPDTAGFVAWEAIPELVTPLDGERGEARNHDLLVIGAAHGIPTLVAIEAKAGESFGEKTVAESLSAVAAKTGSGVPRRIAGLIESVTGKRPDLENGESIPISLADRGYQLFTATVGAVIEAGRRHCTRAVLLVHEFAPDDRGAKLAKDLAEADTDLDAFVQLLTGDAAAQVAPGTVVGPFALQPTTYVPSGVRLYIAKAVTTP